MSSPHHDPSPGAPSYGGAAPPPSGYPGYPGPSGYPGDAPAPGYGPGAFAPTPSNGLAIAALVLGIVSLLGGLVPLLGWFVWPLSLAAIGFAFAGLSRAKDIRRGKGLAVGGMVTGVLSLVAIAAWTALFVVGTKQTADLYTGEALFGCDTTRSSYENNVEEFRATEGREPQSDQELVDEGYRTWVSDDFDVVVIDGRAEVVEQAGGTC